MTDDCTQHSSQTLCICIYFILLQAVGLCCIDLYRFYTRFRYRRCTLRTGLHVLFLEQRRFTHCLAQSWNRCEWLMLLLVPLPVTLQLSAHAECNAIHLQIPLLHARASWCIFLQSDAVPAPIHWADTKLPFVSVSHLHRRYISIVSIQNTAAAWRSGSALVSISEVNLRRAVRVRLVLRWVTRTSLSVCNQPPTSTQPGHPFMGRCNEYQPKGGDALWLGSKGRYGSCVGGR